MQNADIDRLVLKLEAILSDSLAMDHRFDWDLARQNSKRRKTGSSARERPWTVNAVDLQNVDVADGRQQRVLAELRATREALKQERAAQAAARKRLYAAKDPATLLQYWAIVLERSEYPEDFPRSRTFDYSARDQRLVVDFALPPITCLPRAREIRCSQSGNTLESIPASPLWLETTYRGLLIKIALRTMHELFQSDVAEALTSIALRGKLHWTDELTGLESDVCVLLMEATKAAFTSIDLGEVDARTCFARLNGVLSENLANPTTAAPQRSRAAHR